jgi:drug/metabolite transporter (DMT)-like permease
MVNPTLKATLALVLGLITLGFSAILVRTADAPGTVTSFYRMALAACIVGPFFWREYRKHRKTLTPQAIGLAVLGGFLFGMDLTFWSTGITISGATNPTLMANTAPLWVGLGSLLIFREKQNVLFWIGLALAMLGAGVVLGEDLSQGNTLGLGTFYGLVAAIFYGIYMLVSQRGRARATTLIYFWLTTTSSAVTLFFVNLIFRRPFLGYNQITFLNFLVLAILVQVIGWLILNYAQGFLPASVVSPTLLGQPVLTALIATAFLGEILTTWHIVGGASVLIGVYLVHRNRWTTQTAKPRRPARVRR